MYIHVTLGVIAPPILMFLVTVLLPALYVDWASVRSLVVVTRKV